MADIVEAVFQGLLLVTDTNGASVCACVYVGHPGQNEGRSQPTHSLSTAAAAQQQQQWYITSESRKTPLHRNACVPSFQLVTPPGVQVEHIPKGNLAYTYR